MAHVALLERLAEIGLNFDLVIGASAGSIVGGLYCLLKDPQKIKATLYSAIEDFLPEFSVKFRKNWGVTTVLEGFVQRGSVTLEEYYPFFRKLFGRAKFSDCKIDFKVPVFNLQNLETDVIDTGYLVDAVLSSSSVPGFFEPNWLGGYPVADGGVLDNVPVELARNCGADYVLASAFELGFNEIEDPILNILGREDEIRERIIQSHELAKADDVVIHHVRAEWDEFDKYEEVYEESKEQLRDWIPGTLKTRGSP